MNFDNRNKEEKEEDENFALYKDSRNINGIDIVLTRYKNLIKIMSFILVSLVIFIISLSFQKLYFKKKDLNDQNLDKTKFNIKDNNINSNNEIKVKKKINIKYLDFWPDFKYEDSNIQKILEEKYEVVLSQKPDYIIFSEYGGRNYGFENKFNCIKIFISEENSDPDFSNTDYAIGVHYNYTDKGDRYFRKPTETPQLSAIHSVYNVTQIKGIDIKKKKFCAWVVSNGEANVRNLFYDKLSLYKKVDSGGRFKNNVGGPVKDKLKFLSNYKFSICFENSKSEGYISEKLFEAFEAGTIPIYYGDDTVLQLINNKAYIHVKDENDFDEKIELIKKIDQNDTLYEQMIKEKIVIDDNRYPREFQKYRDFIYHIFEQDKEKAKRFERKK